MKDETEEEEDSGAEDGENVFMKPRSSRTHYLEIVKEMEYVKGLPPALLLSMMIDWVLTCEVKRKKSKNINGTIARQMRECLIRIYCTIGEIQNCKESTKAERLSKQLDEMKKKMEINRGRKIEISERN